MRITRKDFLKTGATAIAVCVGLGETRCSDDEAPPAQSPGGAAGRGGSSGTGGSAGTAGTSGSAGAQGSAGTGAGQTGTGGSGGSGATGGMDAGADAPDSGADASGGSAGTAGTTGSAGSRGEGGVCSNVNIDIETDHPHDIVIPSADILGGVAKSYRMTGDHDHTVMMRAIDFERLRAGELVTTISSDDDGHTHLVEIRCG